MPKVSDDMQRLTALFEGTWRGDETLHPSEWDPVGGPAYGVWTVKRAADGFALTVDYEESRAGAVTYVGHGVHGWDGRDGCFYVYWFDNLGVMPKAAVKAALDGDHYGYTEASPFGHTRMTYDFSGGELVFTIARSADGEQWKVFHEGRYRRD